DHVSEHVFDFIWYERMSGFVKHRKKTRQCLWHYLVFLRISYPGSVPSGYWVISLTICCTRAPLARPLVSLAACGMTRLNSLPLASISLATMARSSSSLNCEPCK